MREYEGRGHDWILIGIPYYTIYKVDSTVQLGHTKFTRQHEIKSGGREDDAVKGCGQYKMYEAVANIT